MRAIGGSKRPLKTFNFELQHAESLNPCLACRCIAGLMQQVTCKPSAPALNTALGPPACKQKACVAMMCAVVDLRMIRILSCRALVKRRELEQAKHLTQCTTDCQHSSDGEQLG